MSNVKYIFKIFVCLLMAISLLMTGCNQITGDQPENTLPFSESSSDLPVDGTPADKPSENKKRVAITFDDGPHNVRTREIVDELAKYGFTATFFVVGNRVDGTEYRGGDTVKYVIDHGHEVGIHGYTHKVYYHECSDSEYEYELSKTLNAIRSYASGYNVRLMRPVGGYITDARVQSCEYSVIMWNVDSLDYKNAYFPDTSLSEAEQKERVDTIVENVMSNVKDGSIILMHDIYLSTSHATAIILERLYNEGYEVVSVSELLGNPTAGTKYNSAN